MPRHASNAERIARAAAEVAAGDQQKAVVKAAKPKAPPRPRAAATPKAKPRMKIIWGVGRPGVEPVKTFPYKERGAADAEAQKRGGEFRVVDLKVPME
jgi:hypothetical protein